MSKTDSPWPLRIALALSAIYLVVALVRTHADEGLSLDAADYALVGRNLARGLGFTSDIVHIHVGLQDEVRRVPELHGILRPLQAGALFALFGPHEGLLRGLSFV